MKRARVVFVVAVSVVPIVFVVLVAFLVALLLLLLLLWSSLTSLSSLSFLQIKSESFLEDLNNILNAGDVPNIFAMDELDTIYTAMKPIVQDQGLQPTKSNFYSAFTKRVRANTHSVVCMR